MIIGCGGVASVAIHKCCQNSDVFEEILIASRTKSKCDALRDKLSGGKTKIRTAQVNADHAVSSFNNAGFDILGGMTSLMPYQKDVLLNLLTCGLIFFGGIGFLTILDLLRKRRFRTLNLHSKVVLLTSISLIVIGTLLLKLTDHISWLGALFQSVSARTAGFNTFGIGEMSNAGLFVLSMKLVDRGMKPAQKARRHCVCGFQTHRCSAVGRCCGVKMRFLYHSCFRIQPYAAHSLFTVKPDAPLAPVV